MKIRTIPQGLLLLVIACALPAVCQVSPAAAGKATPSAATLVLPSCPPAGLAPTEPSQPGTGHHTVTLSWNASPQSGNAENNAVGYCLYRSRKENSARQTPTCTDCEQINKVPVTGTTCVDSLVLDSTTYYYVVVGINAQGKISSSSSEALAPIPSANQPYTPTSSSAPPACREAPAAK